MATLKHFVFTIGFTLLLFTPRADAQVTFTSWVHPPEITLYASVTGAGLATGYFAGDDTYSAALPLGFVFHFFGNPFNFCVIGSNGDISFDSTDATRDDPWSISSTLADNLYLYNKICGPWCDMDVYYGGEVAYFMYGSAPNRQFVITYCHVRMFDTVDCTGEYTTAQITLQETSDIIEVHITHKTSCSWNGGHAIIGVINDSGTVAVTATGRDYPDTWTATNEGWRFTPTASGTTYSVSSIPYSSIPYYAVYWYDSVSGSYLGTGDSIVLTPSTPTTYKAVAIGCIDSGTSGVDTIATGYMRLLPLTGTNVTNIPTAVQNISLFPNPATTELTISSDHVLNTITVLNLLGQTVISFQTNSNRAVVNTAGLPQGAYVLKINGSSMRRFVKE